MIAFRETAKGLCFSVYIQPRASNIDIVGCHEQSLKIRLTAPPIGGAANKQCRKVLAKALSIPQSAITITSGQASRRKNICVTQPGVPDQKAMNALKSKLNQLVMKSH